MTEEQIRRLELRAQTMLPPASVMKTECAADAGTPGAAALLEHMLACGAEGRPLCAAPCKTVVFSDRVLLRCAAPCERQNDSFAVTARGRGRTREEAEKNALYALTLPADKKHRTAGSGPIEVTVKSCVFNRAAYLSAAAL